MATAPDPFELDALSEGLKDIEKEFPLGVAMKKKRPREKKTKVESIEKQGDEEEPVEEKKITVISWNIHGPGIADIRNRVVPQMVKDANPDVVLLQETKVKALVESIKCEGRSYKYVKSGDGNEAKVLYDSKVFECDPPGHNESGMDIGDLVKGVCSPRNIQTRRGTESPQADTFKQRVAAVRLKHKDTGKLVVFMSFHNVYSPDSASMANTFCRLVSNAAEGETALVVAGADLNCDSTKFDAGSADIPLYDSTERRKRGKKKKVDYFIFDKLVGASVTPHAPSGAGLAEKDCIQSLDHDLLKCKISLSMI